MLTSLRSLIGSQITQCNLKGAESYDPAAAEQYEKAPPAATSDRECADFPPLPRKQEVGPGHYHTDV